MGFVGWVTSLLAGWRVGILAETPPYTAHSGFAKLEGFRAGPSFRAGSASQEAGRDQTGCTFFALARPRTGSLVRAVSCARIPSGATPRTPSAHTHHHRFEGAFIVAPRGDKRVDW